jgi:Tol biopolymer transport system component
MLLRRISCAAFCSAAIAIPATAQETTRVSVDSTGAEANRDSSHLAVPALSSDGRFVAFQSSADNLVANDTNACSDVFVHDRVTGVTERVSVDSSGTQGDFESGGASLSADGGLAAFASYATNLVQNDNNGEFDVFVHDRTTGVTERVSVDSAGGEGNGWSGNPTLTPDGRFVVFSSAADNLVAGDTNGSADVFIHDRLTGTTERVSVDSSGAQGHGDSGDYTPSAVSADGNVVAFESAAADLVPGDTNGAIDIFVRDRALGTTERVNVSSSGAQTDFDLCNSPSLSADGRVVAFYGLASNLVAHDTNSRYDVFVHDRVTKITERVSVDSAGAQATGGTFGSVQPSLSADGRIVLFGSDATNLVANDTNGVGDLFTHDRVTGVTERVSVDSSGAQGDGDDGPYSGGTISADGLVLAFASAADNLVPNDTNNRVDVFVHEFCSTAASWSNYGAGFPGTNGVPSFTSRQNPVFGSTVTLDLANSYANPTAGLLFIGFQRTSIHSRFGGDLLVAPALSLFVTFSYGGDSFTGAIPADCDLCGVAVDLQAIEADPGAAKGVSFTAGLELVIGR